MRSCDLVTGEQYRLRTGNRPVVRVLETPAELTSQARVRVQFESGVKKGETGVVPSIRILEPVRADLAPNPRADRPRLVAPSREPIAGDEVTWAASGPLRWCVESIGSTGLAQIRTTLFEKDTVQTVPVSDLRVAPLEYQEATGTSLASLFADEPVAPTTTNQVGPPLAAAPTIAEADVLGPKSTVDVFLDDLLFTLECIEFYRRRFEPSVPKRLAADHLREEIRAHGELVRVRPATEEYIRIRVPGRFDVVLPERPGHGQVMTVRALHLPKRARRRRSSTFHRRTG